MLTETTKTVKTARRTVRVTGRASFGANPPTLFLVAGQPQPVGAIVETSDSEARDLIERGLAVDATGAEVTAAGGAIVVAPVRDNESWVNA